MNLPSETALTPEKLRVEPLPGSGAMLHFPEDVIDLTSVHSPYGSAYLGSLGLLGIDYRLQGSSLAAHGTSQNVVDAIPALQEGIDGLAVAGSRRAESPKQDDYYRMIAQLLGRVTGELSTNVGSDMRFPNTVLAVTVPFADYQRAVGSSYSSRNESAGLQSANAGGLSIRSRSLHRPGGNNVIKAAY